MRPRISLLIAVLLLAASTAPAAVPNKFSLQGVLRDSAGKLQSMMVNVTVSLFDAQTMGNKLAGPYGPTAVMATNGLFTFPMEDASIQTKLGSAAEVWLEVTVGNDTFARQLVTPQLYALMCGTADVAKGLPGVTVSAGKVGIGTTTPSAKLQISDDTDTQQIIATYNPAPNRLSYLLMDKARGTAASPAAVANGDDISRIFGRAYNAGEFRNATAITSVVDGAPGATGVPGALLLWTSDGTATGVSERMRLASSGNVGIGTPTPRELLQVGPYATVVPAYHNGFGAALKFNTYESPANTDKAIGTGGRAGVLQIGNNGFEFHVTPSVTTADTVISDMTQVMSITYNGTVGIGTTTPQATLQVVGDIRVGTSTTNGCLQNFAGTALVGTCSSDARLKRNIAPIANALDKLTALKPVTYQWRQQEFPDRHFGPERSAGLIAQDVERVLPELVSTDDKGFKMVSYGVALQMLTVQAVKELRAENSALRARLDRIEARVGRWAAR